MAMAWSGDVVLIPSIEMAGLKALVSAANLLAATER